MPRIMIVDDDVTIQMELEEYLNHMDHTIVGIADTGVQAIETARQMKPDLILMDINLPGEMDGISAARTIKGEMDAGVVFVTGFEDPEYIERAKLVEPFGYVMKPFDKKEINGVIEIALHKRKLELDLKATQERLEQANFHLQKEIEERKRIEETQNQTLSQLQATLEATVDGIAVVGFDSKIKVMSNRFNKIWHMPDIILDSKDANEALDFVLTQLKEPETFSKKVHAAFADPPSKTLDMLYLKDGRIVETYSRPQKLDHQIIGRVWAFRDITEPERTRRERQSSQDRLQALSNAAFESIFFSEQGICLDQNDTAERMFGYGRKEAMGRSGTDWVAPEDREKVKNNIMAGYKKPYEVTALRKDGSKFPAEIQGRMFHYMGKPIRVTALRDITSQKQTEKEIHEIFAMSLELICIADINTGTFLKVNPAFTKTLGYSEKELLKSPFFDFVHPADIDSTRSVLESIMSTGKRVLNFENRYRCKDGSYRWLSWVAHPDLEKGITYAIARDITDQRRIETQLKHAQKMETISTLTAGIAHDYNNLLSIVMGNLSIAMEAVTPGTDLMNFLNDADMASRKIRDLTHELMSLSEGGGPVKVMGSLKELLSIATDNIPADGGISLKESIAPDLWPVPHDPYKMGAVFRNIMTNAVEAMSHGGTLMVSARNFRFKTSGPHAALPLKQGDYVQISIQDDGTGIPEKHLGRIFDPYFSTKAMGVQKGMGLSLATTYSIVKKHGGHIAIDSSPGAGTTIDIYLPAEKRQEEMDSPVLSKNNPSSPVKRVLVMDDEEMLRTLAQQMLERLGYEAATVNDGIEAIAVYKKQRDSGKPFDAVILDLTIKGGMGGEETIQELSKIEPHIKAIVSSGYFHDPIMTDFESYGFTGAIPKPYRKEDLKKALAEI